MDAAVVPHFHHVDHEAVVFNRIPVLKGGCLPVPWRRLDGKLLGAGCFSLQAGLDEDGSVLALSHLALNI